MNYIDEHIPFYTDLKKRRVKKNSACYLLVTNNPHTGVEITPIGKCAKKHKNSHMNWFKRQYIGNCPKKTYIKKEELV